MIDVKGGILLDMSSSEQPHTYKNTNGQVVARSTFNLARVLPGARFLLLNVGGCIVLAAMFTMAVFYLTADSIGGAFSWLLLYISLSLPPFGVMMLLVSGIMYLIPVTSVKTPPAEYGAGDMRQQHTQSQPARSLDTSPFVYVIFLPAALLLFTISAYSKTIVSFLLSDIAILNVSASYLFNPITLNGAGAILVIVAAVGLMEHKYRSL